jgi:NAD-dependent dihydropyrimidine dehydrogenase PreA subunit
MIVIDVDAPACTGCQLCVIVCPSECFGMEWKTNKAIVIDEVSCILCMNCEDICPPDCIRIEVDATPPTVRPVPWEPSGSRRDSS